MTPETNPRTYPTRKQIRDHWAERMISLGKIDERYADDPNYATCFACKWRWEASEWEHTGYPLERAHILARSEGGPDTVENLHLLCPECHKASEMVSGDAYWAWLESRSLVDRVLQLAMMAGALNVSTLLSGDVSTLTEHWNRWSAAKGLGEAA